MKKNISLDEEIKINKLEMADISAVIIVAFCKNCVCVCLCCYFFSSFITYRSIENL